MRFGKDIFCRGMDPYNFRDTGDIVSTITTDVGHATAIGPRVAIRKNKPFIDDEKEVCGTIDANIFIKNNNQDNSKYIIYKKDRMTMREAIVEINKDAPHQQDQLNYDKDAARTLAAGTHGAASHLTKTVCEKAEMCIVRRLTTVECSRLMGFPDNHLKPMGGDSAQYRGAGNSWAVNCARFIMSRIHLVSDMDSMKYATVCSGVEAHSLAVHDLGDEAIFYSEIEKPQSQLLKAHYPKVPNFGDFTKIHLDNENGVLTNCLRNGEKDDLPKAFYHAPTIQVPFKRGELDILSGGIPCTDVSVAGKREGMKEGSGTRSSLAFNYQKLIDDIEPKFVVYENVPGIFSSNGGKDFIWFISKIMNSGYTIAWRVLDAQYVTTDNHPRAVPQRRRRLWLVAYRGNDWRIPTRVVFELKKDLTNEPPKRICGKGFTELNPDFDESAMSAHETKKKSRKVVNQDMFAFDVVETDDNKLKVSRIIDFSEMPSESNFAMVSKSDIYSFVSKIGEPGYIGPVFRTDKKKTEAKKKVEFDLFSQMNENEEPTFSEDDNESEDWVGANKISPKILDSIGNAGILANGMIATMTCHEWTSGIQLSPKTYNLYTELVKNLDFIKANDLLPKAYDGTVCSLSDILEENPDEKYNLSWRACYGILRRAESRAKELPINLYLALIVTIRSYAGIVKWVALNGRDTKKKESDLSEREIAMDCFNRYVANVIAFDDIEAIKPSKKSMDEDEVCDSIVDSEMEVDEDGDSSDGELNDLPFAPDVGNVAAHLGERREASCCDTKRDMSRCEVECSPTLLATAYKEPPAIIK